jgi:endonuclease III
MGTKLWTLPIKPDEDELAPVLERAPCPMKLTKILDRLEKRYGKPKQHGPADPFGMVLHRNSGYPQSDERCDNGFAALKEHIGLKPTDIVAAKDARIGEVLRESKSGMLPEERAHRLKEIATIVEVKYGGDLKSALNGSPAEARKVLKQFPTIGDSAADRILLFSGIAPVAAIPANGVRVPMRIAFGAEKKNYAATYRAAQEFVGSKIPAKVPERQRAYLLLKAHGEELCKDKSPLCEECPISADCAYFRRTRTKG